MPVYEIRVPDGRKVKIRADDPQTAEQGARQWYAEQRSQPSKPAAQQRQVSTGEDVGRSYLGGLTREALNLSEAIPGNPVNMLANLRVPGVQLPRASDVVGTLITAAGGENLFGYKPQTQVGRYAEKAGEFTPGVVTGGSGAGRSLLRQAPRAIAQVVAPAAASEGARQGAEALGGGEGAQAVAETLGGLAGGVAAGTGARRVPQAQRAPRPTAALAAPAPQAAAPMVGQVATRVGDDFAARAEDARAVATEFDVPITRGQQTGDFDQIAFEQAAARNARGTQAGETMRSGFQEQRQAVQRAGEGLAPQAMTPYDAAGAVRGGVREAAETARGQRDAAYKSLETLDADVAGPAVRGLPDRLDAALNEKFFSPQVMTSLNPRTAAIYGEVKKLAGSAPDDVAALPLRGVERIRQAMNSAARTSQGADAEALGIMRKEFDGWLDDVVDQKLIIGDDKALAQLKEARRLHRDYRATYGGGQGKKSEADRMMQKLLADETTDTDAANLLFGRAQITGASGPVEVVKRIRTLSGGQGQTWGALRSGAVSRLMRRFNPDATGSDYKALANDFAEALDGSGAPMMRELFSREELNRMRRFKTLLDRLSPPEGTVNRSGTGYEVSRLFRQVFGSLGSLAPFANKLLASYEGAVTAGRARRAVEPGRLSLREIVTPDARRAAMIAAVPATVSLQGYERDQREQSPQ